MFALDRKCSIYCNSDRAASGLRYFVMWGGLPRGKKALQGENRAPLRVHSRALTPGGFFSGSWGRAVQCNSSKGLVCNGTVFRSNLVCEETESTVDLASCLGPVTLIQECLFICLSVCLFIPCSSWKQLKHKTPSLFWKKSDHREEEVILV